MSILMLVYRFSSPLSRIKLPTIPLKKTAPAVYFGRDRSHSATAALAVFVSTGNRWLAGSGGDTVANRNGNADLLSQSDGAAATVGRCGTGDDRRSLAGNGDSSHRCSGNQSNRCGDSNALCTGLIATVHRTGLLCLIGQDGVVLIGFVDSQRRSLTSWKLYPSGYAPSYAANSQDAPKKAFAFFIIVLYWYQENLHDRKENQYGRKTGTKIS